MKSILLANVTRLLYEQCSRTSDPLACHWCAAKSGRRNNSSECPEGRIDSRPTSRAEGKQARTVGTAACCPAKWPQQGVGAYPQSSPAGTHAVVVRATEALVHAADGSGEHSLQSACSATDGRQPGCQFAGALPPSHHSPS